MSLNARKRDTFPHSSLLKFLHSRAPPFSYQFSNCNPNFKIQSLNSNQKMEKYEDLGAGNFGVARKMRNRETKGLVSVKFIQRGHKIDEFVEWQIINHRSLTHPNVMRFKEVVLTPTHLAIVMEHAAGGALFDRISNAGQFSEDEASKFVDVSKEVLEFLYKVEQNCSLSRPESDLCFVLEDHIQALSNAEADLDLRRCKWFAEEIDRAERHRPITDDEANSRDVYKEHIPRLLAMAELADVWSCGVTLYLMLVGAYVFQDPEDPKNSAMITERIMSAQYKIPDHVLISQDCQQLLARIFVADPDVRIKIQEIRQHPWFLKNLPEELSEAAQAVYYERDSTAQMHSL